MSNKFVFNIGNRGKATSFYDSSVDSALAGDLTRILKQADQPIPDWLRSSGGSYMGGGGFGGVDVRGVSYQYLGKYPLNYKILYSRTILVKHKPWQMNLLKNGRASQILIFWHMYVISYNVEFYFVYL